MSTFAVGGGKIDQEGFLKFLLHMFRQGYSRGMNVSQRGAGANMSVDVNVDSSNFAGALVMTSAAVPYYGYQDATTNTAISTSDPSNPRIDTVVAYIDLSLITSATTNNVGALKFKAVTGTPAGSPTAPSGATIQASIGAGNPYVQLANVAVAAAASSIVNANITDTRNPMAFQVPYLYGGASNTNGHRVPNQADGTVVTTTDSGTVSAGMVATGIAVQVVSTNSGAVATGTTAIPQDDTIPQNTEGDQYMTQAITPKSATNRLNIEVVFMCSQSGVDFASVALFQDATANALAATSSYGKSVATGSDIITLKHDMVAGTTSSTTFKVRAGTTAGSTLTFNGQSGARRFGGITVSNITITEYKA